MKTFEEYITVVNTPGLLLSDKLNEVLKIAENKLTRKPYYCKTLTRIEVENDNSLKGESGTFLVRKFKNQQICSFVISIKGKEKYLHIPVFFHKEYNKFYITNRKYYKEVTDIIEDKEIEQEYNIKSSITFYESAQSQDNWTWILDDVKISEAIGEGCFGKVYKGRWRTFDVALKTLKENDNIQEFKSEICVLKELNHKNIITFFGVYEDRNNKSYIVCKYTENDTLLHCLEKSKIDSKDYLYVSFQIANGMTYLESQKIIHGDLAARNILVDKNFVIKIADFGLASKGEKPQKFASLWAAPERFSTQKVIYSSKSDVWSFAIVLVEIYSDGKTPYYYIGADIKELKRIIMDENYKISKPRDMPKEIYNMIKNHCLNLNPQERPSFEVIKFYLDEIYYSETDDFQKNIKNPEQRNLNGSYLKRNYGMPDKRECVTKLTQFYKDENGYNIPRMFFSAFIIIFLIVLAALTAAKILVLT